MASGSGSASTSIDIEGLLKEVPDSMQTTLPEEMCIYHVPVNIRQVNKDAYTPQVICIGPIHQKNENQVMKELKRRYFRQFLNRLRVVEEGKAPEEWKPPVLEELVETLVKTITRCEVKIRKCYEDAAFEPPKDPKGCEVEIVDCSEDDSSKLCKDQKEFCKMILWDAVFIFELFLKHREFKGDKKSQEKKERDKSQGKEDTENYQEKYKDDYIIAKPWLGAAIRRDLILLENQLPFWILDDLYGIVSRYIITVCSCPPETGGSCPPETDKTCCSCLPITVCSCPPKTGGSCPPETDKTCCSCLPKTGGSCPPETDKTCCSCLPKTDCCCPCITFPALTRTFFKKYNKNKNKNKTSPEKPLRFTDQVRSFLLPKDPNTKDPNSKRPKPPLHFTDLVRSFLLPKDPNTKDPNSKRPKPPLHFTHLVRSFLLPKDPNTKDSPNSERPKPIKNLYGATRLHQAGMKFKPKKPDGYNIKSWTEYDSIKNGELHFPTLVMDDQTDCIFRNLMALEQCHYPNEAFICEYVKFLDFLVDTEEDADLLIKSEVIVNRLGESDDVAKLINKLCQGIVEVHSCYSNIAKDLNEYYDSPFNKSKAYLRRQYFKNVWIGTGTVVGLIVLLITLGNFVRSFF